MRKIDKISIHCSDTNNPNHDNLKTIKIWHTSPPPNGKGWDDIGYHFFIRSNGTIEIGRPLDVTPAAVEGYNLGMIAICLHGKDKLDFNQKQFDQLENLIKMLMGIFNIRLDNIQGHNYWNPKKDCPVFNVDIFKNRLK